MALILRGMSKRVLEFDGWGLIFKSHIVHVLYNRSRRVGCFLFGLVALQCGIVTRFTVQKIDVVPFDGICNVQETPVDTAYFM